MKDILANLLGGLLLLAAAAGLMNFSRAIERIAKGQPMVPFTPRRFVPWGLLDLNIVIVLLAAGSVLVGACLWFAFPQVIPQLQQPWSPEMRTVSAVSSCGTTELVRPHALPPEVILALTAADSILKLAVILAMVAFVSLRVGATARDWGWNKDELTADIWLGVKAFTVLVPVVLMVQQVLVYWLDWESQHPLIESLKVAPSVSLYAVSFFAAVVMAPIAEEWAFRVLLQGWLEKVAARKFTWEQVLVGGEIADKSPAADALPEPTQPQRITNVRGAIGDPRQVQFYESSPAEPKATSATDDSAARPYWPIFVSAALFAAVHISHGPDFIPLFILAVGMGYLYRQTHRITPSLVVHFLLNLFSMISMALALWPGN